MAFNFYDQYQHSRRYFVNLGKITQKKQFKSFAWISLTLLTITFFALAAIRPTLVTIAKLNREIKDKRKASQQLQNKINSLIAAQKTYAQNVEYLPLLDAALPTTNQFPQLAYFFEEQASLTGTEIKNITFEKISVTPDNSTKAKAKGTGNGFLFTIVASGNYAGLSEFLKNLEASRRIITIDNVSFGTSQKIEDISLTLSVSGQVFFEAK